MCNHDRYRSRQYMQLGAAWKELKQGRICWISKPITHCKDCGEDISKYRIRRVATVEQYLQRR